jgi:hypothetical protein
MTHTIRLPAIAAAVVAVLCLASLTPTTSNQVFAQQFWTPNNAQVYYYGNSPVYGNSPYYGNSPVYNNGYSPVYNNGYGTAYGVTGYTGYGSGPYGYGTAVQYGYPTSAVYGFQNNPTQNLYNRAFRLQGGNYRSLYNPTNTRYYSPYGYRGY